MAQPFYVTEERLNIARGLVKNTTHIHKFAYNPTLANGVEETIWAGSNSYPWAAINVANTMSCVSSSNTDILSVELHGLDENYNELIETVLLAGMTPVLTTNKFLRVNQVHIHDQPSSNGNITAAPSSNTDSAIAMILAGDNQTTQAVYTVPNGKTGYLMNFDASASKGGDALVRQKIRFGDEPSNGSTPFRLQHLAEIYENQYFYVHNVPTRLPGNTDIYYTGTAAVGGTRVSVNFEIIVIDD